MPATTWSRTTTGSGAGEGFLIIAYNPRHEDLSPEALLARGYDTHGTPYAPCGRLCRSNGYDYQSDSRQYVCGLPCPLPGTGAVSALARRSGAIRIGCPSPSTHA